MKAIELRAAYADALLRRGYLKLPEHPLVNREGEGPYFNGSALTPNIGYFLGQQQRPSSNMFTQQRVFWTRFADLMSQRPAPIFTIFQVMMSYYQFEQPDLQEALDLGFDMLTDVLGLSRHDLLVLVPEQTDLGLWAQRAGALEENLVTWKQTPKFQVDDLLSGFYCKILVKHRHGLLPILDIVNMYGPAGTLMVDSCMLLERMAFVLQGKRTWYETEMFLPLMSAIEEAEGSRVFDDLYVYQYASLLRSLAAVLADGAELTGKGKGHVVKKILRQLLQDKAKRGYQAPLHQFVQPSLACLQNIGYEWSDAANEIEEVLRREEEAFQKWHGEAERFLHKQVQLLVNGKRQSVTLADLDEWKDSRGVPQEMAADILIQHGFAIDGYEAPVAPILAMFSDAYPFEPETDGTGFDGKRWLQEYELRR